MVVTSPVVEDGQTALSKIRPMGADKVVSVNGKEYTFREINGVSIAWIDEDDILPILQMRIHCCGGKTSPEFRHANSAQVAYWKSCGGKK